MVRLFFALECPGLETESLPRIYISENMNYHITIAFLGERSDPEAEAQRVSGVCIDRFPLKMEYQTIKCEGTVDRCQIFRHSGTGIRGEIGFRV